MHKKVYSRWTGCICSVASFLSLGLTGARGGHLPAIFAAARGFCLVKLALWFFSSSVWSTCRDGEPFLFFCGFWGVLGKKKNGMELIMDSSPEIRKLSHQAPTQRASFGVILMVPEMIRTVSQKTFCNWAVLMIAVFYRWRKSCLFISPKMGSFSFPDQLRSWNESTIWWHCTISVVQISAKEVMSHSSRHRFSDDITGELSTLGIQILKNHLKTKVGIETFTVIWKHLLVPSAEVN